MPLGTTCQILQDELRDDSIVLSFRRYSYNNFGRCSGLLVHGSCEHDRFLERESLKYLQGLRDEPIGFDDANAEWTGIINA